MIITVPHFMSETDQYRDHDLAAGEFAVLLDGTIFLGPIPRRVCDLNREECRSTDWRKLVRRSYDGRLVDVHSYPSETNPFLDCYILLPQGYTQTRLSTRLYKSLVKAGISTQVFQGAENDIINEATIGGQEAILLEINEDNDPVLNQRIARVVNQVFNQV